MRWILLQINETAAAATDSLSVPMEEEVKSVNMLELAWMGGWAMLPILALLVLAIYIFIERYRTIKKSNTDPEPLMRQISEHVRSGDLDRALMLCDTANSPFSRMVSKGIKRLGAPLPDIVASIENEGKIEVNRLEKSLAYLATIAGAAPMIGFLGTVAGMIKAFMTIAQFEGSVSPSLLADGIYQAMITTAAGLIVGIPAYVGYNVLTLMVNNVISKMELISAQFVDLLSEPLN